MTVTEGTGAAAVFDRARTLERLRGDEALLARIAGLFLRDGPRMLSDIRDAIDRRDREGLLRRVHALKGAVGNFSAEAAFRAAANVEEAARNGGPSAAALAWPDLNERVGRLCRALREVAGERIP